MSTRQKTDEKQWMNTRELAELLGKSVRTIEDWRYGRGRGGPPHHKLGGEAAYHRQDVERWIKKCRYANGNSV